MRPGGNETDRRVLLFYQPSAYDIDPRYPGRSISGFAAWFFRLVNSLSHAGASVAVNDYELAQSTPSQPIGLVGHPALLEDWRLANPAILGPCLFDHPSLAPGLLEDARYRGYIVTCDWLRTVFARHYPPSRIHTWYAGIELDHWPDFRGSPKTHDFLVYDKLRDHPGWNRKALVDTLLRPILQTLAEARLRFRVLRYGNHSHQTFRGLLQDTRALLFVSPFETQGMAYQEAMACGLPVLAWDPGYWSDPRRPEFEPNPVPATSVPYFSRGCGERFHRLDDFRAALSRFLDRLDSYDPRGFVSAHLSPAGSGELYLRLLTGAQ